jgi:hypothetical protein
MIDRTERLLRRPRRHAPNHHIADALPGSFGDGAPCFPFPARKEKRVADSSAYEGLYETRGGRKVLVTPEELKAETPSASLAYSAWR